jgi:hypothetical protein
LIATTRFTNGNLTAETRRWHGHFWKSAFGTAEGRREGAPLVGKNEEKEKAENTEKKALHWSCAR